LVAQYRYIPPPKAVDNQTLNKLYEHADQPMRAWILLALNFGYYGSVIATLRPVPATRAATG